MPPSQDQQQRGVKRKKPPTFQHLPADPKKLKRSWVEVQKIKSKWKAQKRKEGLVGSRSQLEDLVDAPEDRADEHDDEQPDDAVSRSSEADSASEESEEESEDGESEDESADEAPSTSKSRTGRSHPPTAKNPKRRAREETQEKPSLRELQRQAYSKASLHNHKSRPLNRHKGPATSAGRGGGRGGGDRGAPRGRGRGQPDMGLRMKAMLEKIKQNMS
ncbi:hypothetical protein C8Q77DRAFT_533559 [Trametes polyzona]|nr:hypothetical protein C8Q77DRAFT_533559 [Trametes polyzona]